jgi:SAM-dependent methyltransferase/uncharacterized protein YbaR (Trm112 family)
MNPTRSERARRLLERALPLLRCPACGGEALAVAADAPPGLTCAACERRYPLAGGVLNLYTGPEVFTAAQRSLQTRLSTGLYEHFRWLLARVFVGYTAREEVARFCRGLEVRAGDTLLDVACGPANFTVPLARQARPGLVVGLDLSPAQLARAGLDNVLLVRGDVHRLPFRDRALTKVNCAGGLHQFPDPARALAEVARVLPPGGRFAGSTFARHTAPWARRLQDWLWRRYRLHFVDLAGLAGLVERAGFRDYRHEPAPRPWFGYYQAARA